jgi:hypothetical protein
MEFLLTVQVSLAYHSFFESMRSQGKCQLFVLILLDYYADPGHEEN